MSAGAINQHDILLTGRNQLLTIQTAQILDSEKKIQGVNRNFIPPNPPAMYLRERMFVFYEALVASGTVEIIGRFEYSVVVPTGVGTKEADQFRKEIADAFRPDRSVNGLVNLAVDSVERVTGRTEDSVWFVLPVNVNWRAYTSLFTTT